MSEARMTITGYTTEPVQRISQSGKAMLDVSVAHTPRRKNRQTGEWEDVTDKDGQKLTLWARARFFEDEADHMARHLAKGMYVEIEGEPRLNAYVDNEGNPAASLELYRPVVKIIPRASRQGGAGRDESPWGTQTPAGDGYGSQNQDHFATGGDSGGAFNQPF